MTHQRRNSDRRLDKRVLHAIRSGLGPFLRENWYRDIWLTAISALVVLALIGQGNVLDDIQEGRRAAVDVTCAATSAVINAGRATITGGAESLDPEFARNLEKLGYPSKPVRERQARKAAKLYAGAIAREVERATGVTGVVKEDGSLDCERLAVLSRVD